MNRSWLLVLLAPLLLASKCVRKQQEEIVDFDEHIEEVAQDLQVVSIDPAWGREGEVMSATLYGAGFQQGARVRFGEETEAARVVFEGDVRLGLTVPPLDAGRWDVWVLNPDGTTSVLREGLTVQAAEDPTLACERATLYFDFDSARLTAEASAELQALSDCLSRAPGVIRLEGHCDERGTTEYNLALGERRGNTVQRTLVGLGISPDRLSVVSYGEERPVQRGSNETAWAANRRVELEVIR